VGRFAGDEFVILVFGEATSGELQDMVGRVRLELATPMSADATSAAIHAGIGVVDVHQDDQRTAEEILRDADPAMYEAKRAGRRRGVRGDYALSHSFRGDEKVRWRSGELIPGSAAAIVSQHII
jgi:diguanylate cyclase (GGDEF)-like protein